MTSRRPLSLAACFMASLWFGGCGSPASEEPETEASSGTETAESEPAAEPPGEAIAEPVPVEEAVSEEPAEEPVEAAVVVPPTVEEPPVYTGPQGRLCGCGCCGEPTQIECVASEAEIRRRERADQRGITPFGCRNVGCSAGTLLRVCTPDP